MTGRVDINVTAEGVHQGEEGAVFLEVVDVVVPAVGSPL